MKTWGITAMTKTLISIVCATVIFAAALVGGGILLSTPRHPAQQAQQAQQKNAQGVVRVSVVEGSAVVQRGDSRVQTNAVPNAPMLPGDYISTGKTSQAELQFDGYTAVRLGGDVQARIARDDTRRLQLARGAVEMGLVRDGRAMQIDTPSITVRTQQAGDVRISVGADGSSWISGRRGGVDVVTPQRTYALTAGETLVAQGSASNPSVRSGPQVAVDSFDNFNAERDKTMVAALNASPNLNPIIAGYDNLDAYGQWQGVAGYGQSWVPNEPAGWVPYRNGSWAWEGRYGWTWVGSEPWGWAPYHYGNWYYCSCGTSGWAWLPPAYASNPNWSPALVGFFGFDVASAAYNNCGGSYAYGPSENGAPPEQYGSGGAAPEQYANGAPPEQYGNAPPAAPYSPSAQAPYGEGGPSGPEAYSQPPAPYGYGPEYPAPASYAYPYIGWVPIAPYETYYPWYPGGAWIGLGWGFPRTRIINVVNINVTRIYRNFRHGGASGTTIRNFRHGTISGRTIAVSTRQLGRRFGTIHGALPIAPTRANLSFSHGTVHAPVTFSKAFDSPRFASDRGLAARTSFPQQRKAVAHATRDGRMGRMAMHAPVSHSNSAVSRATVREPHGNARVANAFQTRGSPQVTRQNANASRGVVAARHQNAPLTSEHYASRENSVSRENSLSRQNSVYRENSVYRQNSIPARRANTAAAIRNENNATLRDNSARMRENSARMSQNRAMTPENRAMMPENRAMTPENRAMMPENRAMTPENGAMRAGAAAPRQAEASRNEFAPSTPWERFSATRGESRSMDTRAGEASTPNQMGRQERMPSDSWGRFSSSREQSYDGARNPYAARESNPSYNRGAPSYSRGSYPSYSRGSYPSYSRGSYGSPYSRESYPSYSRGSYGSAPSYPRGNSGSPRSSGGGDGGGRHGGGRPPHT